MNFDLVTAVMYNMFSVLSVAGSCLRSEQPKTFIQQAEKEKHYINAAHFPFTKELKCNQSVITVTKQLKS